MDELLTKLLEAEVLSEETRVELKAALTKQLEEAAAAARAEATASVTAELNEQWITEREALIEALDSRVTEALTSELKELREDIERFRDLEAEKAVEIAEAKAAMAETLKSDVAQLIEKLDAFLTIQLTEELNELREDIAEVKQIEFGRQVFESFYDTFKRFCVDDDSTVAKLSETEKQLADTATALAEAQKRVSSMERAAKLESVLAPLSGRTKEVMEAILRNVDTSMLEEAYKTYIGRVLKETSHKEVSASGKEDEVLAEGVSQTVTGVAKTGDDVQQLDEDQQLHDRVTVTASTITESEKAHLRRLAGITR